MTIHKAQDFLDACEVGLILTGQTDDEYKQPEWIGTEKQWNAYTWLKDGVYDNEENRYDLIREYLK